MVSMHLLVLSAFRHGTLRSRTARRKVSMHLLVLSAFRPKAFSARHSSITVSMHLLVLSAFRLTLTLLSTPCLKVSMHLLVLSAFRPWPSSTRCTPEAPVSMHLLVLSAFRLGPCASAQRWGSRLNAPFGAQCFPTRQGAAPDPKGRAVSMHLLVLSAFRRPEDVHPRLWGFPQSQCTFWCSVLSDVDVGRRRIQRPSLNAPFGAQCFPTEERKT